MSANASTIAAWRLSILLNTRFELRTSHLSPLQAAYLHPIGMSDYLTVVGGLEALLAAFAISVVVKNYFAKPKLPHGVQLPPGPPSLPLLGNALAVDGSEPWVTYKTWGSQYGKHSRVMTTFC